MRHSTKRRGFSVFTLLLTFGLILLFGAIFLGHLRALRGSDVPGRQVEELRRIEAAEKADALHRELERLEKSRLEELRRRQEALRRPEEPKRKNNN